MSHIWLILLHRFYCDSLGLEQPRGECEAGYYCTGGATSSTPVTTSEGGLCEAGYYCPAGSTEMIPCITGMYCQNAGLHYPDGNCSAGYFCLTGAEVADPTDGVTGKISALPFVSM